MIWRASARCTGGAKVMAVVKADGYGTARNASHAPADADAFGVAAIADGQRLRAAGSVSASSC